MSRSTLSRRATLRVDALEDRSVPAMLLGLTTANALITFDSAAPTKILSSVRVSGLAPGEDLVSIDSRGANGQVYGLTSRYTLYTLSPSTGRATLVGAPGILPIASFPTALRQAAIDFNPSVDRLRIVSPTDENFRINPNTGAVVDGDPATVGVVDPDTDLSNIPNPNVVAVAYDRNFQGTSLTTLFGIDSTLNTLVTIGGVDGTPSPNGGVINTISVVTVNGQTFNFGPRVGFEIAADGTAFAAMTTANGLGTTVLYTVNLATGAATVLGRIGTGTPQLDAITTLPRQEIVFAVTASNRLVSFKASDPKNFISAVPLRNLLAGESVTDIDFRPATGQLYGLTSTNRILSINKTTGETTQLGVPLVTSPQFTANSPAGFDFNPTVDRLRLVNAADENLRFNPLTNAPVDSDANPANGNTPDTTLAYDAGDPNVGSDPNIVGVAYDRNDNNPATATTLFGIDSTLNTLVTIGGVDGTPSPNGGLLFTAGSLGVDATDAAGLDIIDNGALGNGAALAILQLQGDTVSKLFQINLNAATTNQARGAATLIGTVGGGEVIRAMAIAPATIQFSAPTFNVSERTTTASITITRTGGVDSTVSVNFSTLDGTAISGLLTNDNDYLSASQTVTFLPGETSKVVTVSLLNDRVRESTETVLLTLSSLTGGNAIFGTDASSILNILNDD